MRVASLLPSATEIVAAVGASETLVARSHECDFPPGLGHIPVLTKARADYDPSQGRTASEVDRLVRESMAKQESLYRLDPVALAEARPHLIITQDVCHVCSIDVGSVRTIARHMRDAYGIQPDVLSLNAHTVEGVLDDMLTVGDAVKKPRDAQDAVVRLRNRLFRAEDHVNAYAQNPVVGFLEWTDPLYVAGHWTVQLIERAGGRHPLNETVAKPDAGAALGPQRGERVAGKSIAVEPEIFAATKPDYLVVCPCGLTLEQAESETAKLAEHTWYQDLPAVKAGRVAVVDGNQMFNRPGPRLVDAYEWLVGWLHGRPELIPEGFPWREFGTESNGI
ncbi:MAG: ABC transporter substrate-binding protein [Planctomycetota bacterium]